MTRLYKGIPRRYEARVKELMLIQHRASFKAGQESNNPDVYKGYRHEGGRWVSLDGPDGSKRSMLVGGHWVKI